MSGAESCYEAIVEGDLGCCRGKQEGVPPPSTRRPLDAHNSGKDGEGAGYTVHGDLLGIVDNYHLLPVNWASLHYHGR